MISNIEMSNVSSFKNRTELKTDKKINLVYGLNGAGKSTISNFLQNPSEENFRHCKIQSQQDTSIIVYNQKFIQDTFYVADKLKGIFSLSKENKIAEEKIRSTLIELQKNQDQSAEKTYKVEALKSSFTQQRQKSLDEIWKIKNEYSGGDRVLEYCLEGLKGNKERLFEYLQALPISGEALRDIETLKDEASSLSTDGALPEQMLPLLSTQFSHIEKNTLFQKSIVGNNDEDFGLLIDKLGNVDWVREGFSYTDTSNDPSLCPYCQEPTINAAFISKIKSYFDEEYERDVKRLEQLQSEYQRLLSQFPNAEFFVSNRFSLPYIQDIVNQHQKIIDAIQTNDSLISEKRRNPKQKIQLIETLPLLEIANQVIAKVNKDIEKFNIKLKNKKTSLETLKTEFWMVMRRQYDQTISRYHSDQKKYIQARDDTLKELDGISANSSILRKQLEAAQKETVNVDEAVDAINQGLLSIGIDSFQVKKHSENLYRVVRAHGADDVFHTLSEGEKMMISFLYFCELCKGKSTATEINNKRIAVIDDPISSLSHIFVFNIGQIIRSFFFKSEKISQLFVLTHSLYFFYELTYPNHERREKEQKLFRIVKTTSGSVLEEMKYEEIQNDYQAYWSVINDSSHPPALIANCMRNVVEYFFNFVRKKDLNNVFQMPELQDARFQSFNRYINRESHSLGQNILDMKEFDYKVFKEGLALLFRESGYSDHYKAMAKL